VGHRRRAREYAVQALFQVDLTGDDAGAVLVQLWSGRGVDPEVRAFAERLVRGVVSRRDELDRRIVEAATHWRIERMAVVDRNVLRLAVYELLAGGDVPPAVVIDEAIDVGQRFGGEESGAFINGILDAVRRRLQGEHEAAPRGGNATSR
jgi:N utilization substance protein B